MRLVKPSSLLRSTMSAASLTPSIFPNLAEHGSVAAASAGQRLSDCRCWTDLPGDSYPRGVASAPARRICCRGTNSSQFTT